MIHQFIFFLILGIDAILLFFQIDNLSISSSEAYILYEENSFLSVIFNLFISVFGSNDYTLRIPIILLHILSVFLFYSISTQYLKNTRDRLWLLLLYVMLPGTLSASLVLSHAIIVLFGLMLFVFLDQRFSSKYTNILLGVFAFLDGGFAYLFLPEKQRES